MKAMGFRLLRSSLRSLPLALGALLLGCQANNDWSLTYRLWNNESFHNLKRPASEPRLQIFEDERQSDVLVIYDEMRENSGTVHRRAFFANRNLDRIRAGRKPRFVSPAASHGLKAIPVIHSGSGQPMPAAGLAVLATDARPEFILYSEGRELASIGLPSYGSAGSVKKTLLTPLTVTGDTLIVGTVAGLYAALIYAQSGASFSTCH